MALLSLLASGICRATGWLVSEDTLASLRAVERLGAQVRRQGATVAIVPPAHPLADDVDIDCGNSGTTCRLLCGLLAGWLPTGVRVTLRGDASLSQRPMRRVVAPLLAMGARIEFLGEPGLLPLRVTGAPLQACPHELPVPSAQVKSAVLLAGLRARGTTTISGAAGSRDHTELMLAAMGVSCTPPATNMDAAVTGGVAVGAFDLSVPGDPSTAAFFHVAAALVPGSDLLTPGLLLNHSRIGALSVLRRAGVQVDVRPQSSPSAGETVGEVRVRQRPLVPFTIAGAEVPGLVDEIPVLTVLALAAKGESAITGAQELRVKESDRLAIMAANLQRWGAKITELPDGLRITGPAVLQGGGADEPLVLKTAGDHRVAMAMAVAALISRGCATLDDFDCAAVSFPHFFATFATLLDSGVSDRPF